IEWFEKNTLVKQVDYALDALGRRVQKVVQDFNAQTSQTRRYIYNGMNVIAEVDEENELLATYTNSKFGVDDTLSVHVTSEGVAAGVATAAGSLFYAKDALGSVMHLLNNQ